MITYDCGILECQEVLARSSCFRDQFINIFFLAVLASFVSYGVHSFEVVWTEFSPLQAEGLVFITKILPSPITLVGIITHLTICEVGWKPCFTLPEDLCLVEMEFPKFLDWLSWLMILYLSSWFQCLKYTTKKNIIFLLTTGVYIWQLAQWDYILLPWNMTAHILFGRMDEYY